MVSCLGFFKLHFTVLKPKLVIKNGFVSPVTYISAFYPPGSELYFGKRVHAHTPPHACLQLLTVSQTSPFSHLTCLGKKCRRCRCLSVTHTEPVAALWRIHYHNVHLPSGYSIEHYLGSAVTADNIRWVMRWVSAINHISPLL